MSARRPETEIARAVATYLEQHHWTVYAEVVAKQGRADIVATLGRLVWVVEVKGSLSLDVLAQAARWRTVANLSSVAVPVARRSWDQVHFVEAIAEYQGIGWIEDGAGYVREQVRARLNRQPGPGGVSPLLALLRPEHRTYSEPGNARSQFWSPFKDTIRTVAKVVAEQPGITLSDLLRSTPTHYSSISGARSSLAHWIATGKVPGVELRRDGRTMTLHPVEIARTA